MGKAENIVCNACLRVLALHGIPAFRINTGAFKIGNRFIRYGAPGLPDIIGVLPDGRFLGCETKRPEVTGLWKKRPAGKLSEVQKAVHEQLRKSNALIITVRSSTEMLRELQDDGYCL